MSDKLFTVCCWLQHIGQPLIYSEAKPATSNSVAAAYWSSSLVSSGPLNLHRGAMDIPVILDKDLERVRNREPHMATGHTVIRAKDVL
jgi:hypothetical protein